MRRIFIGVVLALCFQATMVNAATADTEYVSLLQLFEDFREQFRITDRATYLATVSERSVKMEFEELLNFEQRLAAFKDHDWPVSRQVDLRLIRAEMNGLRFAHTVTRPWSTDPGYYADFVREIGYGHRFPLSSRALADFSRHLKAIGPIFANARDNLSDVETIPRDLATLAIRDLSESREQLEYLATRLSQYHPEILSDVQQAVRHSEEFSAWLESHRPDMNGVAGVGRENYNWLLEHVYLIPYSIDELRLMVELEDNRVITFQRLEQLRNAHLPQLQPVSSQEEYRESVNASIEHLMNFIKDRKLFSMPDYLVPGNYPGSWHGFDRSWPEQHDYFFNFSHRESLMEEAHEMVGHHFDELRADRHPHPVRHGWRPHKISTARAEGFAFAIEELLMHAGYLDHRSPRTREVAYEQAAFRTVRAMADLRMHNLEWDLEHAMDYAVANAPHGKLLDGSDHLWFEMGTTLRGTGHHMLMVIGKVQFMKLFRDYAHAKGDDFQIKEFLDRFFASGVIPFSLIRMEMLGSLVPDQQFTTSERDY
mgnify:FL=1